MRYSAHCNNSNSVSCIYFLSSSAVSPRASCPRRSRSISSRPRTCRTLTISATRSRRFRRTSPARRRIPTGIRTFDNTQSARFFLLLFFVASMCPPPVWIRLLVCILRCNNKYTVSFMSLHSTVRSGARMHLHAHGTGPWPAACAVPYRYRLHYYSYSGMTTRQEVLIICMIK